MGKSNKAEVARRVAIVEQLIVEGKKTGLIVQNISAKWGISERQGYTYIKKAWQNIKRKFDKDRDKLIGFHIAARINLYKKAYESKKWMTCKTILEDLAKLQGLYVSKHAFTDPEGIEDYGALTSDDLVKRLAAILNTNGNDVLGVLRKALEMEKKRKGVK